MLFICLLLAPAPMTPAKYIDGEIMSLKMERLKDGTVRNTIKMSVAGKAQELEVAADAQFVYEDKGTEFIVGMGSYIVWAVGAEQPPWKEKMRLKIRGRKVVEVRKR
jgi:hypothetical protein